MARIFLVIAGLMWLAYGIYMLIAPGLLGQIAGISASGNTGAIELRAMYGGLESAVGLLVMAGALVTNLRRTGLLVVAYLCSGLGVTRLVSALLAGEFSTYTLQGLSLEIPLALIAIWFLTRRGAPASSELSGPRRGAK